MYLSDISGAFDRVFKEFLMAKLYRAGLPDFYLNFLSSYLEPRIGKVAVEGTLSDLFEISNTGRFWGLLSGILFSGMWQWLQLPKAGKRLYLQMT